MGTEQLTEISKESRRGAEALRQLQDQLGPRRGRKPRSQKLRGKPPFPEMRSSAPRLVRFIKHFDDYALLRQGHFFELEQDEKREKVLEAIEERLRQLGRPLGGPLKEPLEKYDALEVPEIQGRMHRRKSDSQLIAEIYAWEWHRQRRWEILALAERLCPRERIDQVLNELHPRGPQPPLPFPEYKLLNASRRGRDQRREVLRAQSLKTLQDTLHYERETLGRQVLIEAIEIAIRGKLD